MKMAEQTQLAGQVVSKLCCMRLFLWKFSVAVPASSVAPHEGAIAGFAGQGMEFTEASEFARSIQLREPDEAAARPADSAGHMGVDDNATASAAAPTPEPAAPAPLPPKRNVRSKYGPLSHAVYTSCLSTFVPCSARIWLALLHCIRINC